MRSRNLRAAVTFPRGRTFFTDRSSDVVDVVCFAEAEHARLFAERFGGEMVTPETRPRRAGKSPK